MFRIVISTSIAIGLVALLIGFISAHRFFIDEEREAERREQIRRRKRKELCNTVRLQERKRREAAYYNKMQELRHYKQYSADQRRLEWERRGH